MGMFFCCKQKTAFEMLISDWSSDVCSSDLAGATRYERLGYGQVLADDLKVMDASAVALCRDNDIPIVVFNIREQGNLARVLGGGGNATIVDNGDYGMASYRQADLARRLTGPVESCKHDLGVLVADRAWIGLPDQCRTTG